MGKPAPVPGGDVRAFAAELRAWRTRHGLSMQALAETMGFDRSCISHIEAGRQPGSAEFARRADQCLSAGGQLWKAWQSEQAHRDTGPAAAAIPAGQSSGGLIVEHDDAELTYDGGLYRATQRRQIFNAGAEPVTRYLMRISVDRYPGDPDRSNRLYRQRPLRFEELGLTATCDGEEMAWQVKFDRDAFKEVWLLFENVGRKFPLYPGQRCELAYSYAVDDGRWGPWYQRAVRLPTRHLSVRLVFPAELKAAVWGTETSPTAEAVPLATPIQDTLDGETDVFTWATDHPPVGARYRLEWRFRDRDLEIRPPGPDLRRASDRMKAAGIVQQGDPVLRAIAEFFELPGEAIEARQVADELLSAMARVAEHHTFGKGMGLAAPQIGIGRAVAIVRPPGEASDPVVLINPRIIDESDPTDEQYEGCLSFFDVRGKVPRPLRVEVEHASLDGEQTITTFTNGMARLVAHEIDHLHGHLYTDRMREGVEPISVSEYKGTGQSWTYR